VLENLVILTYARQASRMLTLQGIPLPESLTSLRDDVAFWSANRSPSRLHGRWSPRARATSFGITLQSLPSLGNLQKLDTEVRELVGRNALR
jgi:hypothetical protein